MAQSDQEVLQEKQNWHWRNSMRPVRFFGLDARAAVAWLIFLFYIRLHTFIITILITALFVFLEKKGLSFSSAMRSFRSWLSGPKRPGWIAYRKRRMVDYG